MTRTMLRLGNIFMNKTYFLLSEAYSLVGKQTNTFLFQKKLQRKDIIKIYTK